MNEKLQECLYKVLQRFGLCRDWEIVQEDKLRGDIEDNTMLYYPRVRRDKNTGDLEYLGVRAISVVPSLLVERWLPVGNNTWLLHPSTEVPLP